MSKLRAGQAAEAIRFMRVRGAAAIAKLAAEALAHDAQLGAAAVEEGGRLLLASRPTAVSLGHAVACVQAAVRAQPDDVGAAAEDASRRFVASLAASRDAIARHGAQRLAGVGTVLTHCNSATAVAVLAEAHRLDPSLRVVATETRPFGQGLLTARALLEAGVPTSLIVDSAVERTLDTQAVGAVLVGADTVAADGSLFNKIGTSGVAALARLHRVPFLVATGFHKFSLRPAGEVVVEERDADEVVPARQRPRGLEVRNPVFDQTTPRRITAYVTEDGLMRPRRAVRHARDRLTELGIRA